MKSVENEQLRELAFNRKIKKKKKNTRKGTLKRKPTKTMIDRLQNYGTAVRSNKSNLKSMQVAIKRTPFHVPCSKGNN